MALFLRDIFITTDIVHFVIIAIQMMGLVMHSQYFNQLNTLLAVIM